MDIIDGNTELTFEDFKHENGITYWWASQVMRMLNYKSMSSFEKVIDRATKAMLPLGIKHYENIISQENPQTKLHDFKLTRFACYFVVMHASSAKPEVAKAKAYFTVMTQKFEDLLLQENDVSRLVVREDMKEANKLLGSTAKGAGLTNYANFANAGYLGLYNMQNWQLAKRRGVEKKKLFDTMGLTELSANLFKTTMTEEYIRNNNVKGQRNLENTHRGVAAKVRKIVQDSAKVSPENLPQKKALPEVKKTLKKDYRDISKIDKKKK